MNPNTPPKSPVLGIIGFDKEMNDLQGIRTPYLNTPNNVTQNVTLKLGTLESIKKDEEERKLDKTAVEQQLVLSKSILHGNTMERIIRLLQSANGLDKVIRTIQYTSRLLSHILLVRDLHTVGTSAAAKGIRRQFGLTRRLLRIFNNIGQLDITIKLLRESPQRIKNDTISYLCDLVEGLGFMGFGITDALGYLPYAGIANIPYESVIDKLAFHFWLYALVASILGGLVKVHRLRMKTLNYRSIFPEAKKEDRNRETRQSSQSMRVMKQMPLTPPESPIPITQTSVNEAAMSTVKELQAQQYNIGLNVLSSIADIVFPLAALKLSRFDTLSDGVLGFAGCVSSAVGMRKAWKATA